MRRAEKHTRSSDQTVDTVNTLIIKCCKKGVTVQFTVYIANNSV